MGWVRGTAPVSQLSAPSAVASSSTGYGRLAQNFRGRGPLAKAFTHALPSYFAGLVSRMKSIIAEAKC